MQLLCIITDRQLAQIFTQTALLHAMFSLTAKLKKDFSESCKVRSGTAEVDWLVVQGKLQAYTTLDRGV